MTGHAPTSEQDPRQSTVGSYAQYIEALLSGSSLEGTDWYKDCEELKNFLTSYFNDKAHQDPGVKQALESMVSRYGQYTRVLEIAEARLRDQIDMISSGKSNEMAERSIQESKRAILLTVLAFIFLPVSLASSIYGMNVQQINASGLDIRAFVITAIVLLLVTVLLWAGASAVVAYRNHRIEKWQSRKRDDPYSAERSRRDNILLIGSRKDDPRISRKVVEKLTSVR
ncbi:uncharacterized protein B0T15DRAFT_494004 [Chaetomium strumarium]|uniref:Uncharacterized protein n=1 Tax=Chaetomium strumarium TaxID=1170767 RepID=A0AAJ0M1X3_9PEZI|nr:hypothetical protein B0T15DRAFT_494004 [Chaetomium strumarium]